MNGSPAERYMLQYLRHDININMHRFLVLHLVTVDDCEPGLMSFS